MDNTNPFFSKIFIDTWTKHFRNGEEPLIFDSITSVNFLPKKRKLFYYNVGKNITNGTSYQLIETENNCRDKVFLIYDVLSYQDQWKNKKVDHPFLKVKKVPQYKGHLTNLSGYKNFEDFFSHHFSSKSRSNIRKWNKRFKENFNTEFQVFYGEIELEEYNRIFDSLINIIQKRWDDLEKENNILQKQVYYRELCYKMILDKKASLNVLYANDEIVSASVCFNSSKELFFAITTFDIDFRKYNLGHLLIMYIMQWCFENGIEIFDYSKGTYEYKMRWSNTVYDFEHHVIYDKNSIRSIMTGNLLVFFFKMKQFLRDQNVNILYSKWKYWINTLNLRSRKKQIIHIKDIPQHNVKMANLFLLEHNSEEFLRLRPIICDLIFSNPQPFSTIKVYRKDETNRFVVVGSNFYKEVEFRNR